MYIDPFMEEVEPVNPLSQPTRSYPVNLNYPVRRTYSVVFELPEGYEA